MKLYYNIKVEKNEGNKLSFFALKSIEQQGAGLYVLTYLQLSNHPINKYMLSARASSEPIMQIHLCAHKRW